MIMKNYARKEVDVKGNVRYFNKNNKFHRKDGPAVIYSNGTQMWFKNGKLHRKNEPAIIWASGDKSWYMNGKKHNIHGPSDIIFDDITQQFLTIFFIQDAQVTKFQHSVVILFSILEPQRIDITEN